MSVVYKLSDGRQYQVDKCLAEKSGLVSSLPATIIIKDTADADNVVNIDIPDKYNSVFATYIAVLTSSATNRATNRAATASSLGNFEELLLCWNLESYLDDNNYFNWLMEQSYSWWSQFQPLIEQLAQVQQIYLHSPYQTLPDKYSGSFPFLWQWLDINVGKDIVLNDTDSYSVEIMTDEEDAASDDIDTAITADVISDDNKRKNLGLSIHHRTEGGDHYILKRKWIFNDKLERMVEVEYEHWLNGRLHGERNVWYPSEQRMCQQTYFKGNLRGCEKQWYDSGQIMIICYYDEQSHRCGLERQWYDGHLDADGKWQKGWLATKCSYRDGYTDGLFKRWYGPDEVTRRGVLMQRFLYVKGNPYGNNRRYYASGKRESQDDYDKNGYHIHHRGWYPSGQPSIDYCMMHSDLHGPYRIWDEHSNLEVHYHYQHGQSIPIPPTELTPTTAAESSLEVSSAAPSLIAELSSVAEESLSSLPWLFNDQKKRIDMINR